MGEEENQVPQIVLWPSSVYAQVHPQNKQTNTTF